MAEFPPTAGHGGTDGFDATIVPITGSVPVIDIGSGSSDSFDDVKGHSSPRDDQTGPVPVIYERGGNEFGELYSSEHDRLVRLAFVLTGSREVAEDVVQDSFVRLYRHWRTAEHPDRYLRQIVVNECRSHHRRSGRERDRRAMLYVVDSTLDRHGVELADILLELPYKQRAAIVMRFYSDLSENEIADVLGCRPGTVGSLIHRGLERLRKVVEQ
ncbi:MAG TPA: SigE family RNA polymerase sigma factor [Acidimicrobiales bacterium]|nr:SigE family RNA polymerase sigma factor [Acidimicrobiales bacterium]